MSKTKIDQTEKKTTNIGSLLKEGREAKGWSISDVVKQLNLAEEILKALENDDFDALPGPVFIQGYLRSYAKILGIDAQPLIETYQAGLPKQEHETLAQPAVKQEVHSGHGAVKIVSWAIGLGLIVMLGLWWGTPSEPELVTDKAIIEPVAESPALSLPEVTESNNEPAEEVNPVVEPVIAPQLTEETFQESPATAEADPLPTEQISEQAEEETAIETADEAPVSSHSEWDIVFSFTGPCWTNIRDADNRGRIVGNMTAGESHILEGPGPYNVVLGNSSAVELTIDGKVIDLKPYSKQKVIRFTLDPAELLKQ